MALETFGQNREISKENMTLDLDKKQHLRSSNFQIPDGKLDKIEYTLKRQDQGLILTEKIREQITKRGAAMTKTNSSKKRKEEATMGGKEKKMITTKGQKTTTKRRLK